MTKQAILEVYSDVFNGIGKFPGDPYKFQLKPNAKPARHAPQASSYSSPVGLPPEKLEFGMARNLGTGQKVTEWVNSLIMEKKVPLDFSNTHSPGHTVEKKLQIFLHPRDLNQALKREPYYIWSIEEIIGKFHDMTRFTIADFNKGYWMVVLHPQLRKLTTMAFDIGRFQSDKTSNGLNHCTGHFPEET